MMHDIRFGDLSCRRCGMANGAAIWRGCHAPPALPLSIMRGDVYNPETGTWTKRAPPVSVEVGFGPMVVVAMQPPVGAHAPATHSPEAGETIARAIRWHR